MLCIEADTSRHDGDLFDGPPYTPQYSIVVIFGRFQGGVLNSAPVMVRGSSPTPDRCRMLPRAVNKILMSFATETLLLARQDCYAIYEGSK